MVRIDRRYTIAVPDAAEKPMAYFTPIEWQRGAVGAVKTGQCKRLKTGKTVLHLVRQSGMSTQTAASEF